MRLTIIPEGPYRAASAPAAAAPDPVATGPDPADLPPSLSAPTPGPAGRSLEKSNDSGASSPAPVRPPSPPMRLSVSAAQLGITHRPGFFSQPAWQLSLCRPMHPPLAAFCI